MDSLKIRQAAPEDAAALGLLLDQLGYPTSAAEIPKRLDNVYARPGSTVLVAEDQKGDVVGVVTILLLHTLHTNEPAAWLTAVVVEETESRGQGIGSALVARAEEWAAEHGALRISLLRASPRVRTRSTKRATTSTPASG
jgi:predicted N-acetyltransferase YhbS